MIVRSDDLGRTVALERPARRIVCLVPSITETLFALGAGDSVAGITDYCVHPASEVGSRAKVGGTKTLDHEAILSLQPDLVIANAEENRKHQIQKLTEAGLKVFVTFPKTVDGCLKMISDAAALTATEARGEEILRDIEAARNEAAALAVTPAPLVLCPIWKDPYMTINRDTFVDAVLRASGGRNVYEDHPERYPKFELAELREKRPSVIILPTEPYRFRQEDLAEFESLGAEIPAVRDRRIHIVEGELLSWYGPRVARALRRLAQLLRGAAAASELL